MSGKSHIIRDFTVYRLSQIMLTNENWKLQATPIVWDGRGHIGKIKSVSIFPTRPRFQWWSTIIPDIWKLKIGLSGMSPTVLAHYQSSKLLVSSPSLTNKNSVCDWRLAVLRYLGKIWDSWETVVSLIVWDFSDIWKLGFRDLLIFSYWFHWSLVKIFPTLLIKLNWMIGFV